MQRFEDFFCAATGRSPFEYQSKLAACGLPAVLRAPAGAAKTAIALAWLWRRLHGPDQAATPGRLIYALPQQSLVEPITAQLKGWLGNLGLTDEVALQSVQGSDEPGQVQWRRDLHRPAIVVGPADWLVSMALNRGFGTGRATWPIDFALVTNGAHWVIEEAGLCPQATSTLRQLAAFAASFGTAEPFGLTRMSAIGADRPARVAGRAAPEDAGLLSIEPGERRGELAVRLDARRTVRRLAAEPGDYRTIADAAARLHRPGTLTLVVLNTVQAARLVHAALPAGPAARTLVDSRFRGRERQLLGRHIMSAPGPDGNIVIATQAAEAGLAVDGATVITEAAPWPSVLRRAGHCNRSGEIADALLCWIPPAHHQPYAEPDITASGAELEALEGQSVTSEDLLGRDVLVTAPAVAVLRRSDLTALFDTAADPSGVDTDIGPYVRDGTHDLEAQLAWATWDPQIMDGGPARQGGPPADAIIPAGEWRCRAPLGDVAALARRVPVWRVDQDGGWARLSPQDDAEPGGARPIARPGEILLVAAADGGYDPVTGFDPDLREPVAQAPVLHTHAELAAAAEEALRADPASVIWRPWVSLRQHSEETRDQAAALLSVLGHGLPDVACRAVVTAAYLHDAGKAHTIWQDALCAIAGDDDRERVQAGRPWAKSGQEGRLIFAGHVTFRHELASLLLIDGPLRGLLAESADPDLTRYLVLAHHGRLRVQVRDRDPASSGVLLGLVQDSAWPMPPMLGQPASELVVDLQQFGPGGDGSWTGTALALRDKYGPFVLAYLETVVRIADWRSSAGATLPQ